MDRKANALVAGWTSAAIHPANQRFPVKLYSISSRAKIWNSFLYFLPLIIAYRVEPTAVPWLFRDAQNSGFDENYLYWILANAVQPSLMMSVGDLYRRGIPFESPESVLMNNGGSEENLAQNKQMKTRIVLTYTKPTTELETTTKTETIKISGCTPVPFPYDVCLP